MKTSPAELRRRGIPIWEQIVAGGLFTGLSPVASGTAASLVAAAFYFIPGFQGVVVPLLAAAIVLAVGYPLAERIEERLGPDPSFFTLDEFAGQWIALASPLVPWDPLWALIAFLCFRVFDIAKTWPASWFDRQGGALGILGDDVAAAVYANVCAHFIWFGLSLFGIVSEFLGA